MKTAVEYLLEYCERENWSIPNDIIQQAKTMEKEQMIDFAMDYVNSDSIGCLWDGDSAPELDIDTSAEQYYEQTYGGNK